MLQFSEAVYRSPFCPPPITPLLRSQHPTVPEVNPGASSEHRLANPLSWRTPNGIPSHGQWFLPPQIALFPHQVHILHKDTISLPLTSGKKSGLSYPFYMANRTATSTQLVRVWAAMSMLRAAEPTLARNDRIPTRMTPTHDIANLIDLDDRV